MKTKTLIAIIAMLIFISLLASCHNEYYYKGANWDCYNDSEKFLSQYKPLYEDKIKELKQKHSVECKEKLVQEPAGAVGVSLEYYLYNEDFTIRLDVSNAGYICAALYYYGNEDLSYDYDDYENLVVFLNDFICYASYDAKKDCNYFKELYDKSKTDGEAAILEEFHFDESVGSLYYYITNEREGTGGYYYMAGFDSSIEKTNYTVKFEGLLQPIE